MDVQNALLNRLLELLSGVAEYNLARQKQSRTARKQKRVQKKRKDEAHQISGDTMGEEQAQQQRSNHENMSETHSRASQSTCSPPEILRAVTVGINEVTKRLEEQCRRPRELLARASGDLGHDISKERRNAEENNNNDKDSNAEVNLSDTDTVVPTRSATADTTISLASASTLRSQPSVSGPSPRAPIHSVFVCRSDIDPPLLVSHIPYLVAACNSAVKDSNTPHLKLVSLPKGAESKLAQETGLRRVAVLAIDVCFYPLIQLYLAL